MILWFTETFIESFSQHCTFEQVSVNHPRKINMCRRHLSVPYSPASPLHELADALTINIETFFSWLQCCFCVSPSVAGREDRLDVDQHPTSLTMVLKQSRTLCYKYVPPCIERGRTGRPGLLSCSNWWVCAMLPDRLQDVSGKRVILMHGNSSTGALTSSLRFSHALPSSTRVQLAIQLQLQV